MKSDLEALKNVIRCNGIHAIEVVLTRLICKGNDYCLKYLPFYDNNQNQWLCKVVTNDVYKDWDKKVIMNKVYTNGVIGFMFNNGKMICRRIGALPLEGLKGRKIEVCMINQDRTWERIHMLAQRVNKQTFLHMRLRLLLLQGIVNTELKNRLNSMMNSSDDEMLNLAETLIMEYSKQIV